MDLPSKQFEEYISKSMLNSLECEIVINKHIVSMNSFKRMLKYVKNNYTLQETVNRESLDVKTYESDIRMTIINKDNILEYCRTNTILSLIHI